MFSASKKPFSAITVQIDRLTSENYDVEDSSGIVDLVEVVRLQSSGPTEASRALRKKLKYGNVHRQLRALTILDFLIQNAGNRFQRSFADEPLLERLRVAATDPVSDPAVRNKCKHLFPQWAVSYKGTPGMERVTALYSQLPKRKKPIRQQQSKIVQETEEPEDVPLGHSVSISTGEGPSTTLSTSKTGRSSPGTPSKSSFGSKIFKEKEKKRGKRFNLEKEKPEILQTIASASVAGTNLINSLKFVNRESQRVSENSEVMDCFETCKRLRRRILRYIQHIESDEFLGSLIHANEELITALISFEVLDKSVDYDSDSEEDMPVYRDSRHNSGDNDMNQSFAGLEIGKPVKPPRPTTQPDGPYQGKDRNLESDSESENYDDDDDDDDNPFGDRNAINPPMTWREV